MKTSLLTILLGIFAFSTYSQTTFIISTSNFTFVPNNITVAHGDTIIWNVTTAHPVIEVDSTSWTNNLSTPLPGGINPPHGSKMAIDTNTFAPGIHYYVCGVHFGQGMKGIVNVLGSPNTTAINQEISDLKISIYPNPTVDNINLELEDNSNAIIEVFSANGKLIKKLLRNSKLININLAEFPKGNYTIKVMQNGKQGIKSITRN